jgi:two-component system response regulator MprA
MVAMPRILLADDEPSFRSLFEIWLRAGGFDVVLAADGIDALASIAVDGLPDAVVLDVNMPRLDGVELCRGLRRIRPLLPVVLVSAEYDVAALGRAAGASAALVKPSSQAELCGVLRGLVAAHPADVYAA